jgi:hypothetical protein
VVACFTDQYLRGELFHADPHAGNILWTADGQLALLDLGAVGAIDEGMRRSLRLLAAAAVSRNERALARALLGMVHTPADLDRTAVERDLGALVVGMLNAPLGDVAVSRLVGDVFALAQRHGLRFRAEYFLLFRSSMLVDGVLRGLDPSIDPIGAARAYILRSIWRPAWMLPALWLGLYAAARSVGVAAGRVRDGVRGLVRGGWRELPAKAAASLRGAPRARRLVPAAIVLMVGLVVAGGLGSGAAPARPVEAAEVPPLLPPSSLAPSQVVPDEVPVKVAAEAPAVPPVKASAPVAKPAIAKRTPARPVKAATPAAKPKAKAKPTPRPTGAKARAGRPAAAR